MLEALAPYRRFIVTGSLVLFSIAFLGFFRESEVVSPVFQSLIVSVAFFLVIPLLYSKIVLKESLKNLGWQRGNSASGFLSGIVCVALGLVAVFLLEKYFPFQENYLFPGLVESDFRWFVLYEIVLVAFTALLYEAFFRGLVQYLWLSNIGIFAILVQSALFFGLLYFSDDLSWQKAPLLIFAPLSGIIVYYSHSLWYSIAASWIFFLLTDIFLLTLR